MAHLYGQEYTRADLLRRVGDVSQVGGVRRVTLDEGRERGVEAAQFRTGSGLDFTVLFSRCLDISSAHFNGRSLAWQSSTGDVAPAYFEPVGRDWLRSFFGGLVATCGLTTAGAPSEDAGESLGIHGRIGNTPATEACSGGCWDGDNYVMWVEGKMRETAVFGPNLVLTRRIQAVLGEPRFTIHDVIENEAFQPSPLMLLYHVNGGFPAVDGQSRLLSASKSTRPRDAEAEAGKELYARMQPPTHGYKEKVYYHDLAAGADGLTTTALVNERKEFGFYVTFSTAELPRFAEWKMMDEGTYVCGMEPANCHVEGRAKERERGTLQFIQPGEKRHFHLEIGVLDSGDAIRALDGRLAGLRK